MNIAYTSLGTSLDAAVGENGKPRAWRPTIALATLSDLPFDELHLFWQKDFEALKDDVCAEIARQSPRVKVIPELFDVNPWDFEATYAFFYDFAESQDFDTTKNNHYVHISTGTHVMQISLFLLCEAHLLPASLIQTSPLGGSSVIDLNLARYDLIARRFNQRTRDNLSFLRSGIETRNLRFNQLIETIERVVIHSVEPVLLTGPTGAGKSQLAKRIYELKKQKHLITGDFVDVNCATLRGDQAMSTLFGHRKGSFTGAVTDRPGLLKSADHGLLFLDEIGELGLDEQAMLLRAIEEKSFLPLGADREVSSDFQLICGTNRNLRREVAAGRFREDLLERINLWKFKLPGLAERREDIEPNIEYELEQLGERRGVRLSFNSEAKKMLMDYAMSPTTQWRGNFRELNAMMLRLATLAPGGRIDEQTVQAELQRVKEDREDEMEDEPGNDSLADVLPPGYREKYDPFDLVQLEYVVKICRKSRSISEAGRCLFARSRLQRKTQNDTDRLAKYLAKFGLDFSGLERP